MSIAERRVRDREARRRLITSTARILAEQEGWDAVTTRRLSTEIEYSQPVLYKHFASMEDIVDAVALEGFGELAEVLGAARRGAAHPRRRWAELPTRSAALPPRTRRCTTRCSPAPRDCDSVPMTPRRR